MSKLDKIIDKATPMALKVVGFGGGAMINRALNKALETNTVQGLLGEDTAVDFKKYLTPIATMAIGLVISNSVDDDSPISDIAEGAAFFGAVNLGSEITCKKDLLSGMGNGIIGSFIGEDDDLDIAALDAGNDVELEGDDDDDDDMSGLGEDEDEDVNGFGRQLPTGTAELPSVNLNNGMLIRGIDMIRGIGNADYLL